MYRFISVLSTLSILLLTQACNCPSVNVDLNHHDYPIEPTRKLGADYNEVVCKASNTVFHNHVPFRNLNDLKEELSEKGGRLGDFQVSYTGFTTEARNAFQYAVDIWDLLLDTDTKIIVDAQFRDLGSGVLGSAAPTGYYVDFDPKADPGIEYPIALAEKISGRSLNGSDSDLFCSFNERTNWFYDTENPTGIQSNQYDFATVVLHELGHGLGFLSRHSFVDESTGLGFIRASAPVETDIFSLFLEEDGINLILNYDSPSVEVGSALLGNNLFFRSQTVPENPLPQIYAPSSWNGGSSLSHLDEVAHAGTDALMTPSVGRAEVIHDPGLSLTMLYDMGWRSTFISHTPISQEGLNTPIPITAGVFSDDGVGFDSSKVKLVLSEDGFTTVLDTLSLLGSPGSNEFNIDLPGKAEGRYQYYFFIDDRTNEGLTSPKLAPFRYYNIFVGLDTEAPIIDHVEVTRYFLDEDPPRIDADVTDVFTGIRDVTIEWSVNDDIVQSSSMVNLEDDLYIYQFEEDRSLRAGDTIFYQIIANDLAGTTNTTILPSPTTFYKMLVNGVPEPLEYYQTEFSDAQDDFSFDGWSIRTEPGFQGPAMHTEHPYENGGENRNLNFIARFRAPFIITSEEAKVEFNEVVLVEPGEPNSSFGDDEFWDYCIVEASTNGNDWIPLIDGYDSSDKAEWRSRYDAGLSGQISSATGDSDIEFKRSIPLYQPDKGLDINTTIQLRWRLFSDPFAVGWGWSVDDLEIFNPSTTPVLKTDEENDEILLAPNPIVDDMLRFTIRGELKVNSMTVVDAAGKIIQRNNVQLFKGDRQEIPLTVMETGAYFVLFETDDIWITKPFLKL